MSKTLLANLSLNSKLALLEKVRVNGSNEKFQKVSTTSIQCYPRDRPVPTSIIQQEIWFHEQLIPNSNAYNIPIALEISGNLNYSALVQAFRILISRYEILRTSFYTINGIPHQNILPSINFDLDVVSLEKIPQEQHQSMIFELLYKCTKSSFDLEKAPLFRTLSIECGSQKYVLAFVMHHILCDNWSLTLLIQEILLLYNQLHNGKATHSIVPSYQYADYAFWEKDLLSTEKTKKMIDHLKNKIRQFNFELKLPYDFPRNLGERTSAKSKQFVLNPPDCVQISNTCAKLKITPYIFFLSIYHALIYKYTLQNNIVTGTSFLNRPENEQNLMGPFINVALIDSNLEPQMTFSQLLEQIKKNVLDMHSYRFIPLNKTIKSMNPSQRKDLSLTQLFYGFLNFKINKVDQPQNHDLKVKLLNQSNELRIYNVAKFELDLTMWEDESSMGGSLEYMSNVFTEATIDLFIQHYQRLCKCVVNDPYIPLNNIDLEIKNSSKSVPEEALFSFG